MEIIKAIVAGECDQQLDVTQIFCNVDDFCNHGLNLLQRFLQFVYLYNLVMRMKGLEPSLLSELEPKSSASANSATSA